MKFLIDTNVLIPLEPTSPRHFEPGTDKAVEFVRLASQGGHQVFVHPAVQDDLRRDPDGERRAARERLIRKYAALPDPPPLTAHIEQVVGTAERGSNDWVDHHLLAALLASAIDFVVTEDQPLRRKAVRLGLQRQVVTIDEAVGTLRALFDETPYPPPAVEDVKAHRLNERDPIFDSFRADYGAEFDPWLLKCKREHRQAWVINADDGSHAAVAIVNREDANGERRLKLCTFKVGEDSRGRRFGELLLKTVLTYAFLNRYRSMFMTAFEKQGQLIALVEDFGFRQEPGRTRLRELVFTKTFAYSADEALDLAPLDFNVRLGPFAHRWRGVASYVVPIQPRYQWLLFPEASGQLALLPGRHAFGNGLRKAYLCHAQLRRLAPGDNLLFYRSGNDKGVFCVGVAEDTLVSSDAAEVARFVGTRTVYTYDEIRRMTRKPVLAILFRQARMVEPVVRAEELRKNGALNGAPQSIVGVRKESLGWLMARMPL